MRIFVLVGVSFLMLTSGLHAQNANDQGAIRIIRSGSRPSRQGTSEHFTGSVRVDPLFRASAPARASGALVTFEPGARTAWHTHPLGQILIVTARKGLVQRWGDPVQEIHQGDVVWIPPGEKHWHGAAPVSSMAHIAIVEQLNGKTVDWMEKVSDAQYENLPSTWEGVGGMTKEPSAAQKIMGDIDPKLAELTDNVLFGDIWERSGLSKRDRSLITVAALIALNRPEQLRSHIRLARKNGVTQDEIVEVIIGYARCAGEMTFRPMRCASRQEPPSSAAVRGKEPSLNVSRSRHAKRLSPRPEGVSRSL